MAEIPFVSCMNRYRMDDIHLCVYSSNPLYAYDSPTEQRTYMVEATEITSLNNPLKICNPQNIEIRHICVDGGMVTYGLEDYNGDGKRDGRFDCMVFSSDLLYLIELKTNLVTENDNGKWRHFSHAMKQISDYYIYLEGLLKQNGDSLFNYFRHTSIIPFICMNKTPIIDPPSSQRQAEMEKFRIKTALKIHWGESVSF